MMEYKGYIATVEFDDDAGILHGEVVNTRDVITFEGDTVPDIRKAFRESVEEYLAFCAERGEEPDKPFSGVFTVRVSPTLHRAASIKARSSRKSLNRWIGDLIEDALAGS